MINWGVSVHAPDLSKQSTFAIGTRRLWQNQAWDDGRPRLALLGAPYP